MSAYINDSCEEKAALQNYANRLWKQSDTITLCIGMNMLLQEIR